MTDPSELLTQTRTVLLVDWPSRDVPDTLRQAGYDVVVKGGPDVDVAVDAVDLVYCHRPLDELDGIAALAQRLGAKAIWREPASDPEQARRAREIVQGAGLGYVDEVSIADAVRARSS